jgi:hypothetical protein
MISNPSVVVDPISLHIILPHLCVKTVSVLRTAGIGSLKVLFLDGDTDFAFKG